MIKTVGLFIVEKTVLDLHFWMLVIVYYMSKLLISLGVRFYKQHKFKGMIINRRKECERSFQWDTSKDEVSNSLKEEILGSDLMQLREMIWSRKITSEQVLRFYYHRSKTIGRELGAAVESNFEQALQLAKKADSLIDSSKREDLPVMCGLPFSVKENYYMEGFENTHGCPTRIGRKSKFTSKLVEHLIENGGIPFVRTNIPQLLMAAESDNEVYGRCLNPHNRDRVSGGSSGGEGALIGSGCSPAGLGNDVGGSIRIPALYNGIFGYKPTMHRFNSISHYPPIHCGFKMFQHQPYIRVCNGPLAKSVSDLCLITGLMADKKLNFDIDHYMPPLPWREEATRLEKGKKLNIGYLDLDLSFEPSAANSRALNEVVAALKREGHNLIKVTPPEKWQLEVLELIVKIYSSDGTVPENFAISNGMKLIEAYKMMQVMHYTPNWVKRLMVICFRMLGQHRMAISVQGSIVIPANKLFYYAKRQKILTQEFLRLLAADGITHLLSHGLGLPPAPHDTTADSLVNFAYTTLFNFTGLPTGVLPITKVRSHEQFYESVHKDMMTDGAKRSMKGSEGLPVGIQVSAFPFKDEECLALMRHIESIMNLKPFIVK